MDQELELQREMFGIWLKNLRKKSSMVKMLATTLGGQHGLEHTGKLLDAFVRDCEKLYELGYELGYVQGMLTSPEKVQTSGYFVN